MLRWTRAEGDAHIHNRHDDAARHHHAGDDFPIREKRSSAFKGRSSWTLLKSSA
jgi:hypothetical protein